MVKLITRTTILTLFVCCTALIVKAQLGYNYSQYDGGVAIGINTVSGDAQTMTATQSVHFNFTYNTSPYVNFVFELQLGKLAGGDSLKTSTGRQFVNDFTACIFRGQLQFGEFLDYSRNPFYNAMKNFYVSTGIGYVINNIKTISRFSYQNPGFFTGGEDKSKEPFIPFKIGYEFKLFNKYEQPSTMIDIGYQYNLILGDGLDGFSSGSHHDVYTQLTVGIKFALGGAITSYRKQIPY